MLTRTLMALVTLVTLSCGHLKPPPVPIDPGDSEMCLAACSRMEALGCEEGKPLEDGTSCVKFCVETQAAGHALNPTCLSKINSCSEIDHCNVNREGGR